MYCSLFLPVAVLFSFLISFSLYPAFSSSYHASLFSSLHSFFLSSLLFSSHSFFSSPFLISFLRSRLLLNSFPLPLIPLISFFCFSSSPLSFSPLISFLLVLLSSDFSPLLSYVLHFSSPRCPSLSSFLNYLHLFTVLFFSLHPFCTLISCSLVLSFSHLFSSCSIMLSSPLLTSFTSSLPHRCILLFHFFPSLYMPHLLSSSPFPSSRI